MLQLKKWGVGAVLLASMAIDGASALDASVAPGQRAVSQSGWTGRIAALANAVIGGGDAVRVADKGNPRAATAGKASAGKGSYIVVFREAALGAYKGTVSGLPMPQRGIDARGKRRLDANGAQARNYVSYLRGRQQQHIAGIDRMLARPLQVHDRMQHALNGIVTDLERSEAERVRRLPEVMLVEAYREYVMETDTGPRLIGAEPVWTGSNVQASAAYQGEGLVFGIIDSGINFGSPSFAAQDPVDGYQHVNPLGTGTYLGTCAPGGVDEGRCNAKLIGGYDFVCGLPGNQCGQPGIAEEPGFGDTNGHGSHTASTAAGNRRDVAFRGNLRRISGVAPRAGIIAFDVCYTNTATAQGLCPNVATVAAIEQAIVDGVVDVFNYSISGGAQPWGEAVSLAFLNAVDSGIYVAASAGNSGPVANTLGHVEPWVSSTAAAQHGRGDFSLVMSVTGPGIIPEPLAAVILNEGTGGVAHTAAITAPLRVSTGIDTANDGCAAFAAQTFQGAIALIRRGTCSFAIKANNASNAGAIAVIIANNAAGVIIPSVPGAVVPVFGTLQADGNALRDFAVANPTATARIGFPAVPLPNTADALGAFSSRGPAGSFDLAKPDVTAPGVNVLAALAGATVSGFEQSVGLSNGTSMASPHQAGAAGLIRQARPTWTVPEIKSALSMTAKQEVFLEDLVTPANAFARGSGRIRVDQAINAGLVMDESGANYLAANPATGGNPSALNQPSLANGRCFQSCVFTRTFRNTLSSTQSWTAELQGIAGRVSPSLIRVSRGASRTLTITIDSSALPANGAWYFGTLLLTPGAAGRLQQQPALHLPVAIAVQPPSIVLPELASVTLTSSTSGVAQSSVGNVGGSTLAYAVDNSGTATLAVVDADRATVTTGFRSTAYTDTANPPGQYASDDFTLSGPTRISTLFTEGFVSSGAALATVTISLTWSIYPDAGGVPAGNPQTSPGNALWSYTAAPAAAGVGTLGNNIALDLDAAGQNVMLPSGRYWLVVHARTTFANRWVWYASPEGNGLLHTIAPGADGSGVWTAVSDFAGLSMRINGVAECGASWMRAAMPTMGNLAPGVSQPTGVAVSAAGLRTGSYFANLCVSSNDPAKPKVAAPISLQVRPRSSL
ncbi:MAG: S8 family serine peptidase [Luteimonas sp.]